MPEGNGSGGESRSGEGDSSGALWRALKGFFRGSDHDQSLRAQIEEAIEEHECDAGGSNGADAAWRTVPPCLLPVKRRGMEAMCTAPSAR